MSFTTVSSACVLVGYPVVPFLFRIRYAAEIKECKELGKFLRKKEKTKQQTEIKQSTKAKLSRPMTSGQALIAIGSQAKEVAQVYGFGTMLLTLGTIIGAGKESREIHQAAKKAHQSLKLETPLQTSEITSELPSFPNSLEGLRVPPDQSKTRVENLPAKLENHQDVGEALVQKNNRTQQS